MIQSLFVGWNGNSMDGSDEVVADDAPVMRPDDSVRILAVHSGCAEPELVMETQVLAADGVEVLVNVAGPVLSPNIERYVLEVQTIQGICRSYVDCSVLYAPRGGQLLRLSPSSQWVRIQRRSAFRVKVDLSACMTALSGRPKFNCPAKVFDISSSGVSMYPLTPVLPEHVAEFRVAVALPTGTVSMVAELVEVRLGGVALEFGSVTREHDELLGSYIFAQQTRSYYA